MFAKNKSSAADVTLRVVTCNRGENHGHDLSRFIAQQKPDVVVLQQAAQPDTSQFLAAGATQLPHRVALGEFILLSRFPILSHQLLVVTVAVGTDGAGSRQVIPGARHVVDAGAMGQLVIYNVHLSSPRGVLWKGGISEVQS